MTREEEVIRAYVARYRRLFEERKGISDDLSALDKEAKAEGLDPKMLRATVKALEVEAAARDRIDQTFTAYLAAAGGTTAPDGATEGDLL
ncbi:GapR family DNA-binding domain-containing protein [Zavarzinia sp.]|uniref:GapR family DNA-binding domain-containing protein n=1 Tax=Zavarzinia sp. TaxID=2027920 RepID=UPI003BB7749A